MPLPMELSKDALQQAELIFIHLLYIFVFSSSRVEQSYMSVPSLWKKVMRNSSMGECELRSTMVATEASSYLQREGGLCWS